MRLVLCSGHVAVDLAAAIEARGATSGARAGKPVAASVGAHDGQVPRAASGSEDGSEPDGAHPGEPIASIAVARLELLYPFPEAALRVVIGRYPNLREVVWLQEEPRNMGAWSFVAPRLAPLLPPGVPLRYEGRPERASPAEGFAEVHAVEQGRIIESALAV